MYNIDLQYGIRLAKTIRPPRRQKWPIAPTFVTIFFPWKVKEPHPGRGVGVPVLRIGNYSGI